MRRSLAIIAPVLFAYSSLSGCHGPGDQAGASATAPPSRQAAAPQGLAALAPDHPESQALTGAVGQVHLDRGRAALEAGDLLGALSAYETASAYASDPADLALARHRIVAHLLAENPRLLDRGSLDKVALVLDGLLSADPARAHVYRTARANLDALGGQPAAAIASLREVLVGHPDYRPARESLGAAQAAAGQREEAVATLKAVIEADPSAERAHEMLARLLSGEGAVEHARQALRLSESAGNHQLLGGALLSKGGADQEARDVLSRAFDLAPNGDVLYQLAIAEARLGQHDTALGHLYRLAQDSPGAPKIFRTIGEIEDARGNKDQALGAYTRAHRLLTTGQRADPAAAATAQALEARVRALQAEVAPRAPEAKSP